MCSEAPLTCSERGQATIEWTALVTLVALLLGALVAVVPVIDGRSFGGPSGGRAPALPRRYAPNIVYEPGTFTLPVDFRACRSHWCSDAPDDEGLEVHASTRGRVPAAAFTHVLHRGAETFLQYWFYYPD